MNEPSVPKQTSPSRRLGASPPLDWCCDLLGYPPTPARDKKRSPEHLEEVTDIHGDKVARYEAYQKEITRLKLLLKEHP